LALQFAQCLPCVLHRARLVHELEASKRKNREQKQISSNDHKPGGVLCIASHKPERHTSSSQCLRQQQRPTIQSVSPSSQLSQRHNTTDLLFASSRC
jgi:hypothetical protein